MGLLDKLINRGAKALGDAVADKLVDTLNGDNGLGDTFRDMKSMVSDMTGTDYNNGYSETNNRRNGVNASFDQKLQKIIQNAGYYEISKNVPPDDLEAEYGQEIYVRRNGYAKPDKLSYVIYSGGRRVLIIRLWKDYNDYNHVANRQIRQFVEAKGERILDFFNYLPNEEDYMEQRIRQNL